MMSTQKKSPQKRLASIAILGMGRSGQAVLDKAIALGMTVVCFDDQKITNLEADLALAPEDWPWPSLDALIISPGIPHEFPAPHPAVILAKRHGVQVISEIEFALRTGRKERLIAITGTNGKSTTTALTGHILKQGGLSARIGGNIGTPLTGLPNRGEDSIIVLELSSYQLETTPSLRAEIRVILNITPDHLDRHGGWDGYVRAKQAILDTATSDDLLILGPGDVLDRLSAEKHESYKIIRLDESSPAEYLDNPALQGQHNQQNSSAARVICRQFGLTDDVIDKAMKSFAGLPHRLQPAGQFGQIRFINDSKATNGEAAAKALASFSKIHWCAGGLAKEDGLSACLPYLENVCHGYFYGQCKEIFVNAVKSRINVSPHNTLAQAVQAAAKAAGQHPGDEQVILLAPAAASFDQFSSFEARGDAFCRLASQQIAKFQATVPASYREAGHV